MIDTKRDIRKYIFFKYTQILPYLQLMYNYFGYQE